MIERKVTELLPVRMDNLKAVAACLSLTQVQLGRHLGMSQSAVHQYLTGRARMSRDFCARVEQTLDLPHGVMDKEGGVRLHFEHHPGHGSQQTSKHPAGAGERTQGRRSPNALHEALIVSLVKLLASGRVSDDQCAQMLSKFTLMSAVVPAKADGRNTELDSLLARLRVNGFQLVYTGKGGKEEAGKRLEDEFDPAFAASMARYFVDVASASEMAKLNL